MGAKVGKTTSREDLMSLEAGERLARNASEASPPTLIPTRSMNTDTVSNQRMEAVKSFRSSNNADIFREGSKIALGPGVASSSVNGFGTFRKTTSARMSRILSGSRRDMITQMRNTADSGGNNAPLDTRLASFGMRQKVMEGDGNCQFRTLAFNLFGSQDQHKVTRKAAVAHIKAQRDFFNVFFEDEEEFERYLKDMSSNGTWGDELTLRAVVEAYGCEAHVITSEENNWYLVYTPECKPSPESAPTPAGVSAPPPGKQVFLAYVSPVHYNAIVAVRDGSKRAKP